MKDKLQETVDKAIGLIEQEMENPDIFNTNTHDALSRVTGLSAYLNVKSAEAKLHGDKEESAYLASVVQSLNKLIDDMKYKIKSAQAGMKL